MLHVFICAPVITLRTVITTCVTLFFLDMVAVYFLDVMKNVAHIAINNNLPIIIKVPKSVGVLSIIGLGDIIIPGYLIKTEFYRSKRYQMPKIYNLPLMPLMLFLGYVFGFCAAVFAVKIFNHVQPALLFIIPSMLFFLFIAYHKTGFLYKPLVKSQNKYNQRFALFRQTVFYNV